MRVMTLERLGQLVEAGVIGFGFVWAAWAVAAAWG